MGAGTARRIAGALAIAWGLVIGVASAASIPDAGAAQRLVDGARPLVAPDYLARQQEMLTRGRAAAQQLLDSAVPRLADRLGESTDQLQATIAANYPDVAAGLQRLPAIITTTGKSLTNLQRHHGDFADADSFPAAGVSRPAAAIGGIVVGVILVALGGLALGLARAPVWPLIAILVVAGAGVVLPLAASLPAKAQGVENMAGALNLSTATATATRQDLVVVERFHDQLLGRLVPDAATHLGTEGDALVAEVVSGLDALQAALGEYPAVITAFRPDVELREKAVDDFQRLKDIPIVAVTWTLIGASAVVAVAALAAIVAARPAVARRPSPAAP